MFRGNLDLLPFLHLFKPPNRHHRIKGQPRFSGGGSQGNPVCLRALLSINFCAKSPLWTFLWRNLYSLAYLQGTQRALWNNCGFNSWFLTWKQSSHISYNYKPLHIRSTHAAQFAPFKLFFGNKCTIPQQMGKQPNVALSPCECILSYIICKLRT